VNLYNLLVNGIIHDFAFIEFTLLDYDISKYNHNAIIFNKNISKNIDMKIEHPMLQCSYRFSYLLNGIESTVYFKTYHTFTTSPINSIIIYKGQYLNTHDFIIDQNNYFHKLENMSNYHYNILGKIRKGFNVLIIDENITIPLKNMIINKKQCNFTQIIYFDGFKIRINPLLWIHFFKKM
jgi:hypothetical protein